VPGLSPFPNPPAHPRNTLNKQKSTTPQHYIEITKEREQEPNTHHKGIKPTGSPLALCACPVVLPFRIHPPIRAVAWRPAACRAKYERASLRAGTANHLRTLKRHKRAQPVRKKEEKEKKKKKKKKLSAACRAELGLTLNPWCE